MKSLNRKIATQVKAARKRAKLSQRDLSRLVGVSKAHLCNIEAADSPPGERLLSALCRELKLDFDELWCSLGNVSSDVIEFLASNSEALARVRKAMKATRAPSRAA
jgi:transcriptional regulator with XRE-family HTH domain